MPDQDANFWWLSFASESSGRFLGGCIVQGEIFDGAIEESWRHGCNPGGEVVGGTISDAAIGFGHFVPNRLYSKAEIDDIDEAVRIPGT